ncbi:MAG: hypothetical protein J6A22_08715 [Bacteroidales bacterium]|nr:hypothetical protein [Bacteroidales bacterium]
MKRIMTVLAATLCCIAMHAQKVGTQTISGNLAISGGSTITAISGGSTITTPKDTRISINGSYGYFIEKNLEIGADLIYEHNSSKGSNSLLFAPEARYFISLLANRLYYAPSFSIGFGFNSYSENATAFRFKMGLDLLAFEIKATKQIGIGVSFGGLYYDMESIKEEKTKVTVSNHNVDFNLSSIMKPSIGFRFYF